MRNFEYYNPTRIVFGKGTITKLSELVPADAKVLVGSLSSASLLYVKEKFFDYEELLGPMNHRWLDAFRDGMLAVFRLTPEKYHYNHVPVSGTRGQLRRFPVPY